MNKHTFSTANLTDLELKEQGNRNFTARKYEDAIKLYSMAIVSFLNLIDKNHFTLQIKLIIFIFFQIKNPENPTFFTNRALCHLKLKRWEQACVDCRRALEMDQNLVKGHFFLGQSLMELNAYDEAIKHLQRAHDLGKEQKKNFGDDIALQLRIARKKRFGIQEEKRMCQEIELQSYINRQNFLELIQLKNFN